MMTKIVYKDKLTKTPHLGVYYPATSGLDSVLIRFMGALCFFLAVLIIFTFNFFVVEVSMFFLIAGFTVHVQKSLSHCWKPVSFSLSLAVLTFKNFLLTIKNHS